MEVYNEQYYHSGCGPIPYEEPEHWVAFFGAVADRIVADFAPKTVLDAGCAMGYLVAALRDRGVEAYGIDISKYAISKVREDVKSFCVIGSLTEELPPELPKYFDLVTNIEVLEHMYPEDGAKAIKSICAVADTVLFSSTPDDFSESTHLNVQQREYWARLFAENGFFDDVNYCPIYVTKHAMCYRRKADILQQIEDYERAIRIRDVSSAEQADLHRRELDENAAKRVEAENTIANVTHQKDELIESLKKIEIEKSSAVAELEEKEKQNRDVTCKLRDIQEQLELQKEESNKYQLLYRESAGRREDLERKLAAVQAAYDTISNAFCWKMTKPLRLLLDMLKKIPGLRLIDKGLRCWKASGWRYTWKKAKAKLRHRPQYEEFAKKPLFTAQELAEQRKHKFQKDIKFSIAVPLYNTPEKFLREMIQSVVEQTYSNWELCMADGSDGEHTKVEQICCHYAKKDSRIKYRKLEKNLGISGNTNVCLEMSTGDYIGLFDHDDLLHPAALYEVMRAICEEDADFVYTDENTFHNVPADAYCPNFKPDFAPDTLRSNNYICHFTVFNRHLLEKVGKFRSPFDGSQDYDMVLRLTEKAQKIVHIPKILYYWRAHSGSVAETVGAKPYVIEAAHHAIEAHLSRVGLEGEVLDTVAPSMYHIRYKLHSEPLVSIVIPNKDHVNTLRTCIRSIIGKTTYKNYEIVIIENNSTQLETFAYYDELSRREDEKVIVWKGKFNYSAINNFGVCKAAKGDYILLLNNDTEVISPDWIQEMLMFAQRRDVGAVGAKLYYTDDTIQHAGVILGIGGVAGHGHKGEKRDSYGYMSRAIYAQNLSAVTAACMMVRKDVWEKVGGLDETFEVAFNDVDLCMRIRKAGYLIVWTPFAELYHYESKSRGLEDTPEKQKRFEGEVRRFQERWKAELEAGDPYYNPNLTLEREDFSLC